MTTKTLTNLLIGVLLAVAASAYADQGRILVAMEDRDAPSSVGDSRVGQRPDPRSRIAK